MVLWQLPLRQPLKPLRRKEAAWNVDLDLKLWDVSIAGAARLQWNRGKKMSKVHRMLSKELVAACTMELVAACIEELVAACSK